MKIAFWFMLTQAEKDSVEKYFPQNVGNINLKSVWNTLHLHLYNFKGCFLSTCINSKAWQPTKKQLCCTNNHICTYFFNNLQIPLKKNAIVSKYYLVVKYGGENFSSLMLR